MFNDIPLYQCSIDYLWRLWNFYFTKLEEEKIYTCIVISFELMKDWNLNLDALLNVEV